LAGLWLFMPQTGQGQKGPPIRIGATVSLSGKYLEPSAMVLDAMRLWEKQVNQRGGLLGRPVQLVLYDDQSRPELVEKFYHRLIVKDKMDLLLSPYGTPLTQKASELSERHKFVMLAAAASGETLWRRGYKYLFGVYTPAGRILIGFLDVIARQGLESLAILFENTPHNISTARGAESWAKRLGLQVKYCQAFREGKEEIYQLLRESLDTRPDALIFCSYPEDSYIMLDLLKQAKFRPKAICESIAPSLPSFYHRGGSMAEGIFGPSQWEPHIRIPFPGTKEFIENFKKLAHRTPSYHAASAYAACKIIEKGIKHNQSLDRERLRDYILSLDTVTIVGRFRVDSTGMQLAHSPLLIQWQDGKKEIVYPHSMQTAPPRF